MTTRENLQLDEVHTEFEERIIRHYVWEKGLLDLSQKKLFAKLCTRLGANQDVEETKDVGAKLLRVAQVYRDTYTMLEKEGAELAAHRIVDMVQHFMEKHPDTGLQALSEAGLEYFET